MDVQREADLQMRELRRKWAIGLFIVSVVWLIAVSGLVVLQGFGGSVFHLSDMIMTTFIGSTTVNVLATLLIVVKYIFPIKK